MAVSERHTEVAALIEAKQEDEAHRLLVELLNEDKDDPLALFLLGNIHARADHFGIAANLFERVTKLRPERDEAWNNYGMSLEGMQRTGDAREAFRQAVRLKPGHAGYMANVALTYLQQGRHAECLTWTAKALKSDPSHAGAMTSHGFANLAIGNWAEGWDAYRYSLGGKFRLKQDYGLPDWNGEQGSVIVYGEQGIGDEIMYASCLPDLMRDHKVCVDVDARLAKLFARSFPDAEVHGTRRAAKDWAPKRFDYQLPIGELPRFFRNDWRECPKTAYLTPSDDLVTMYRALTDKYAQGRRKIGLSWSGGKPLTGSKKRAITLECFRPIIEANPDCAFFSMEYKPVDDEIKATGLPVHAFHYATGIGADYDQTAAFIASMDRTCGIHTAAHHAGGAMRVPGLIFVPEAPTWIYGEYQGNEFCWYGSQLWRQRPGESWAKTLKRFASEQRL